MMQYCQQCNACYYKESTTCTICGRPLIEKTMDAPILTQGFPSAKPHKSYAKFVSKIFGMISIGVVLILALINFLTYKDYPNPWSLIIIGPIAYAWILVGQIVLSKQNYPTKVNRQVIILSVLLILTDILTRYNGWSLTYVVPALFVMTTIILPIVVASNPKTYYLHVRSLFFLIIMDVLIGMIGLTTNFMHEGVIWTSVSMITAGILLLITMFTFARKDTWTELIKIFRI